MIVNAIKLGITIGKNYKHYVPKHVHYDFQLMKKISWTVTLQCGEDQNKGGTCSI